VVGIARHDDRLLGPEVDQRRSRAGRRRRAGTASTTMSALDILRVIEHNASMTRKMWRHAITSAGQVSLPAEVRHRWGTSAVLIEDEGDRLVVRPVPADPIDGLRGALKERGRADVSATEAMRRWREEDNAAMERKWREHYGE
jgi:bifunctional DNA-binding transcriptional regulator/antitoxin component of YhaV-PrlF toxin-antitoxin module